MKIQDWAKMSKEELDNTIQEERDPYRIMRELIDIAMGFEKEYENEICIEILKILMVYIERYGAKLNKVNTGQ